MIAIAAGLGVTALVAGLSMLFQKDEASQAEDRLSVLTNRKSGGGAIDEEVSLLSRPLTAERSAIETWADQTFNLQRLFDQADVRIPLPSFSL